MKLPLPHHSSSFTLLSSSPLSGPPAYSPLPQLQLFPWKRWIKRVTSRLNQRFRGCEKYYKLLSRFPRVQDDTLFSPSRYGMRAPAFAVRKKRPSCTAYSLTDANYTRVSLWDQWIACELTVSLSSWAFFFSSPLFSVFQGFVGVPQICLTSLSAAIEVVQRRNFMHNWVRGLENEQILRCFSRTLQINKVALSLNTQ